MGHYGDLPEISDDSDDGHEFTTSLQNTTLNRRRSSAMPALSTGSLTFEVAADMEPICEVTDDLATLLSPSSVRLESQEQSISFGADGSVFMEDPMTSLHVSNPGALQRKSSPNPIARNTDVRRVNYGDQVVSEDGEILQ